MRIVMASLLLFAVSQLAVAQSSDVATILSQRVTDGPVELVVQVDQSSFMVAETIALQVTVEGPQGTTVTFPQPQEMLGPFTVLDVSATIGLPLEQDAARRRWNMTIDLESLEVGQHQVPSIEVAYQLDPSDSQPDNSSRVIRSKPLSINVISVLSDGETPTAFRDIKDVAEIPEATVEPSFAWYWIALVALTISAFGAVAYFRRRSSKPPQAWALGQVESIQSMYHSQSIDGNESIAELSDVVRQFAEAELEFPATSLSSEEVVQQLNQRTANEGSSEEAARLDSIRLTGELLVQADRLKFSGDAQSSDVSPERAFETVRLFIGEMAGVSTSSQRREQR